MKKEKLLLMLLAVAVPMFVVGPAWATPWWNRGDPGSTHQAWAFVGSDNPATPEVEGNPYGIALATISTGDFEPDPQWYDNLLGRQGVWHAESTVEILLEIPNQAVSNPEKEIYLEIDFLGELSNFAAYPVPFGGVVELISQEIEIVDTNWKKLTALWRVEPNPDLEFLCYSFSGIGGVGVDYVIVDTICVPEPLTICLLGLGGLLLRRRRTL